MLAAGAIPLGETTEIRIADGAPFRAGYIRDPNEIIIELLEP